MKTNYINIKNNTLQNGLKWWQFVQPSHLLKVENNDDLLLEVFGMVNIADGAELAANSLPERTPDFYDVMIRYRPEDESGDDLEPLIEVDDLTLEAMTLEVDKIEKKYGLTADYL